MERGRETPRPDRGAEGALAGDRVDGAGIAKIAQYEWCSGYILLRLKKAFPDADDPWAIWHSMTLSEQVAFLAPPS